MVVFSFFGIAINDNEDEDDVDNVQADVARELMPPPVATLLLRFFKHVLEIFMAEELDDLLVVSFVF